MDTVRKTLDYSTICTVMHMGSKTGDLMVLDAYRTCIARCCEWTYKCVNRGAWGLFIGEEETREIDTAAEEGMCCLAVTIFSLIFHFRYQRILKQRTNGLMSAG